MPPNTWPGYEAINAHETRQSTLHETVNVVSSIYTDPNDILELNLKQIVTLLWELIKHYQVTKANQESELLLVNWIDATLPDKDIMDFTR